MSKMVDFVNGKYDALQDPKLCQQYLNELDECIAQLSESMSVHRAFEMPALKEALCKLKHERAYVETL